MKKDLEQEVKILARAMDIAIQTCECCEYKNDFIKTYCDNYTINECSEKSCSICIKEYSISKARKEVTQ